MKEFNDIEDLEQLLKPQCEFHASDTLKDEVIAKAKAEVRPRKVRLLPWFAAACVAAIIGLFLMPPEQSEENVRCKVENVRSENVNVRTKEATPKPALAVADKKQQAKPSVKDVKAEEAVEQEPQQIQAPRHSIPSELYEEEIMLSEHDIPITRPENLIDTPEDIAQIAKLEKRAFINRLREQVEIAKAELIPETQSEEN
jgi:hypothetical protein